MMSISEIKRLFKQGAVRINGVVVKDPNYLVTVKDVIDGKIKWSIGKKKHYLMLVEE